MPQDVGHDNAARHSPSGRRNDNAVPAALGSEPASTTPATVPADLVHTISESASGTLVSLGAVAASTLANDAALRSDVNARLSSLNSEVRALTEKVNAILAHLRGA